MKLVVTALVVVLVSSSCGRSAPAALRPSPSASAAAAATASPSPVPAPTSPTPRTYFPYSYLARSATVVAPELPSTSGPPGFTCRLPIYRVDPNSPPTQQVGFLSFPDGGVTLQPAPPLPPGSVVTVDPTGPRPLYPTAFYYDRAVSRWVPVARGAVSPDGRHYAFMSSPDLGQDVVNIVDAAAGDVRTYPATDPPFARARNLVLNYANEGIYLGVNFQSFSFERLWLMDPNTGAMRLVAGIPYLQAVAGSALWLGSASPADANPASPSEPDSLDRFDLVSGVPTPWLYLPGAGVQVVAVDTAGHPIVLVVHGTSDSAELLLLTAPGVAQQIFHGTRGDLFDLLSNNPGSFQPPIADVHGVWFGSSTGIYLYTPAVGMRKVSDQAGYPGNGCK